MVVKVKGNGSLQFSYQYVNADGFLDLVMQIQDQDGVFECGTGSATLTGKLLSNGATFQGSDAICIVGPGC